jgi:hypothetical protein
METTPATTEQAPPEGVASPVPPAMYWSVWVGVFVVITWGMMHLFGTHRAS